METSKVGKRGTVVVPARLRRKFGIEEGRSRDRRGAAGRVLIRPALAIPVEIYTPERKAEFLLSNAVDAEDYRAAVAEVKKMGSSRQASHTTSPGKPDPDTWIASS